MASSTSQNNQNQQNPQQPSTSQQGNTGVAAQGSTSPYQLQKSSDPTDASGNPIPSTMASGPYTPNTSTNTSTPMQLGPMSAAPIDGLGIATGVNPGGGWSATPQGSTDYSNSNGGLISTLMGNLPQASSNPLNLQQVEGVNPSDPSTWMQYASLNAQVPSTGSGANATAALGDPNATPATPATSSGSSTTANSGFAPGFQTSPLGNGWAYNPSTGQELQTNSPEYQAMLPQQAAATPITPTTPAVPTSPVTTVPSAAPYTPVSTTYTPPTDPNAPTYSNTPTNPDGTPVTSNTATASSLATLPQVANTNTPDMNALIKQLQGTASQSQVIDPNDPTIKAQEDAYNSQQTIALRNAQAAAAEQSSPYATGAQNTNARMMSENAAQNSASYQGQLMQNELTARRTQIQNALQELGGTLTQQQQNDLQAQITNLNAAISQQGMSVQNQQFYAGLDQNDKQFVDQLTQNEQFKNMDDALSRYTLAQQNAQYASSLAQQGDIANMQAALQQEGLSNQQQDALTQLAQSGSYQQFQEQYLTDKMSQDQNQFLAQLAQSGNIAQMQDIFNKMQLSQQGVEFGAGLGQNESQFLDQLGLNSSQDQNFWQALQSGLTNNG